MAKNNKVFSLGKTFALSIVFIVIGILLTVIAEKFSIFPIKNNIETMLFTIWSVQATVSTLTIAILALLISLNKEKRYGINILDFMLISSRKFLTFQDEILIILLLIIIQYIFVSCLWLSGSIFLFIVGFLIIIRILYVSIKVLLFEDDVQKDITNYIISSIKAELANENENFRSNNSEDIK
ncbi:hypothetical protein [Bacillus dakarensis]|uniref:hypothetical protein n=1 Tax=Robertmurraya dakarensis TaxID=1926278 RepID=UPI0009815B8A|nr:hypothetical protein [Bacillus dakarensis]